MGNLEALINNLKRTALITSISLATLVGVPNKSEAPIYAQDTKQTIEQQTDELYNYLATQHTEIANSYKNAKLYTEAKQHYEKALQFKDDQKTKDTITKLPTKNEAKNPEQARKTPDKKYENFKKEAIKKIEQTGKQLLAEYEKETNPETKQEKKYKTFQTLDLILEYDPTNETPFLLRDDFTKYEGTWQPKWMANNREQAKKLLTEANEGETDNKESDIEGILGIKQVYKRTDGKIFTRTTVSEERSKEIFKLTDATIKYISKKLEIEAWPFNPNLLTEEQKKQLGKEILIRVSEYSSSKNFDEHLRKITELKSFPSLQARHEDWAPWSRTGQKMKKVFPGIVQLNDSPNQKDYVDDNIVNFITSSILDWTSSNLTNATDVENNKYFWLVHGYVQLATAELLGTVKSKFYAPYNDKYEGSGTTIVSPDSPKKLRWVVWDSIKNNKDVSLEYLLTAKLDKFRVQEFAKSMSIVEFLNQVYKQGINDFLTDQYKEKNNFQGTTSSKSIEEITKKDTSVINEEWKKWAQYNYAGFAYKN